MNALALPMASRGRFKLGLNVEYTLRDKDGNVKRMFVENKLGKKILGLARAINPHPIDAQGQVKPGILNHIAAYGLRIPGITGAWAGSRKISNLVTDAGKAGVASRINGAGSEAAFTYIGVGTGTTAAAAGNTAIETEIADSGLARANATASRVTTDVTNDSARLTYTFSVSGTKAVTESGVLNASSGGVLLARQVFSAINVVSGDTLAVTWTFDVD